MYSFHVYAAIRSRVLWMALVCFMWAFHIWFQLYLIRGAAGQRWIAKPCSQLWFSGLWGAPGCLRVFKSGYKSDTWGHRPGWVYSQWRTPEVLDEGSCFMVGREQISERIIFLWSHTQTYSMIFLFAFLRKLNWVNKTMHNFLYWFCLNLYKWNKCWKS